MPIVLDNITVSYRHRPAVHHVHARFDEGTAWAIAGPNGAGKSTLLKAIMRLLPCDTGRVLWQGLRRRDLAWLPQQASVDRSLPMTVFELAALGLWHDIGLFGRLRPAQTQRVWQALERVGLAGMAQRQIGTLSGGQFQRALFARMLVQDARFLLLDEPFNAVDTRTTDALLALLHECVQAGRGVIAVLHNHAQARSHFAHTLLLSRELIACGATASVLTPAHLARADALGWSSPAGTDHDDAWCTIAAQDVAHIRPDHGHVHVLAPGAPGTIHAEQPATPQPSAPDHSLAAPDSPITTACTSPCQWLPAADMADVADTTDAADTAGTAHDTADTSPSGSTHADSQVHTGTDTATDRGTGGHLPPGTAANTPPNAPSHTPPDNPAPPPRHTPEQTIQ